MTVKAGFLKFRGSLVIICCSKILEYGSHICLGGTEQYGVMLRFKQFDCPVPPDFGYKNPILQCFASSLQDYTVLTTTLSFLQALQT